MFNFLYAPLVAASFEGGGKEGVNDARSGGRFYMVGTHAQNVGVVVAAGEPSVIGIRDESGAHVGEAVGCDAHSDSTGTHQDTEIRLLTCDDMRNGLSEVWIIHTRAAVRTEVRNGMPSAGKQFMDGSLEFQGAVIGADCDTQGSLGLRGSCDRRMGCGITHWVGIYKMKQGRNGTKQNVTRAEVGGEALSDGVGNLRREGGVEVAH